MVPAMTAQYPATYANFCLNGLSLIEAELLAGGLVRLSWLWEGWPATLYLAPGNGDAYRLALAAMAGPQGAHPAVWADAIDELGLGTEYSAAAEVLRTPGLVAIPF